MSLVPVHQDRARAGNDIVGGNKTTNINIGSSPVVSLSLVEKLMERLEVEIDTKKEARDIIFELQFFQSPRAYDEVRGLEAKLEKAGRSDELFQALEKKELFVKLLDRYSLYLSAQRIFARLLSRIDHEFTYSIYPQITECDRLSINLQVTNVIVNPIVNECGIGVMDINHSVVMGMLYWLAEQCFVRWHS